VRPEEARGAQDEQAFPRRAVTSGAEGLGTQELQQVPTRVQQAKVLHLWRGMGSKRGIIRAYRPSPMGMDARASDTASGHRVCSYASTVR
jgi:hypothetical protein